MLVEETRIKRRWQAYFRKLLNDVGDKGIVLGDLEHSERHQDFDIVGVLRLRRVGALLAGWARGKQPDQMRSQWIFGRARIGQLWSG